MPFRGAGMGGMRGRSAPPQAQKVEVPLNLTLEELYTGTMKKRKVTRRIVDAASGRSMNVEETLEIPVKAGWKDGTKITFEGKGDELPGRPPQDIVFVVKQKPHSKFLREGDDLVVKMSIPLTKALTAGVTVDVPTLDNRVLRVPLREVIYPGYERVVKNEGMPISKQGPGSKGDLKIRFEVKFPKRQLSGDEAANLEKLLAGKM
jgi:DnaJ family protein B protein 4